jgi:L-lactate dehydrogenase complex protein LldG
MSSARNDILGKIRRALAHPAPLPGHKAVGAGYVPLKAAEEARSVLPPVGPEPGDWLQLFTRNAADLRAEFHELDGPAAARKFLAALARDEGWTRLASHHGELCDATLTGFPLPIQWAEESAGSAFEPCHAGITECDLLVAQTGSVVVTSRSAGGRALSVLPPHHVVLARRSQLVPDLPAAMDALASRYGSDWPSMTGFITGPSRTGDIERILVLGAHGPKRLTILMV